jgi:hypothetical protein
MGSNPPTPCNVMAASHQAWNSILSVDFLRKLAGRFGVSGEIKHFSFDGSHTKKETKEENQLADFGSAHRGDTEKLIDARNKWEGSGKDTDKKAYDKEREKNKSSLEGKGIEDKVSLDAYKKAIIDQIGADHASGAAVEVLMHHHYIRLQAIHEDHVVVDDPGSHSKANRKVLFEEARAMAMFKERLVLR